MAQYLAEIGCLVDAMPEPHRTALIELGAQGLYADPSYEAALDAFYRRHLCRLDPWPDVLVDGIDEEGANDAYRVMSGPNDLVVTGTLRTWDRRADLARITAPTLVTCGRYDEMTPACARTLVAGIPDARLAVFEDSGHVPHLDEPEPYADMVSAFLAAVDEYR
jgi:proline-specific peptidase